jgi:DNA-binding HxlR family transcriptional regulator
MMNLYLCGMMESEISETPEQQSQDNPVNNTSAPQKAEKPLMVRLDISMTTDLIGNKWRPEILWLLLQGTKRFNQLRDAMPGITQRALSLQLKDLEKQEIVTREVFKEMPMRVEYTITAKGISLKPVLNAMHKWGADQIHGGEANDIPKKEKKPKTPPPPPSNVLTLF